MLDFSNKAVLQKMLQIFLKFSCELPGATTRFVSSVIHELNARDPSRVSSKDLCVLLQSLVILGKHCSHTSSHASMLSVLEGFKFQDFWRFLERCRCLCLSVSGKYFTCGPWHVCCCRVFMLKGFGDQTLSLPRRGKEQKCPKVFKLKWTLIDKLKLDKLDEFENQNGNADFAAGHKIFFGFYQTVWKNLFHLQSPHGRTFPASSVRRRPWRTTPLEVAVLAVWHKALLVEWCKKCHPGITRLCQHWILFCCCWCLGVYCQFTCAGLGSTFPL